MRSLVSDVMTVDPIVAAPDMPYKDIIRVMRASEVSALPVCAPDGRVIGIVTEGDLLDGKLAGVRSDKADGVIASMLMTAPALCVSPETPIVGAARTMGAQRLKHLPVVDADAKIVGIVSRSDLLRIFLRPDDQIRREVVHDVVEKTLWLTPAEAGLTVTVDEVIVKLDGTVPDEETRNILISLCAGIEGVVSVEAGIRVPEAATQR